jgi:aryl-alcohol dehydrogenase-like predicted oxidoreductase
VEPLLAGRARSVVDALATAADGLGVPPMAVALAWLLARPGLAAALVGPRTVAQLRGILAAEQDAHVPDAILVALDDVSA